MAGTFFTNPLAAQIHGIALKKAAKDTWNKSFFKVMYDLTETAEQKAQIEESYSRIFAVGFSAVSMVAAGAPAEIALKFVDIHLKPQS